MSVPGLTYVSIPETIVVHLGNPDEDVENVTVNFIDYIKNVASSELYPTWPENALRANIYAIISIALSRDFNQWYRSRGYNFDITNSTQYDQAYVKDRGTFNNISQIVDDIFNEYIARKGHIEPLFAQFCDGRISQCNGMYQWGSVDLANQGYTPLEILQYYYGNDISIIKNAPQANYKSVYRGTPLQLGDTGLDVMVIQFALNRISMNYPSIPKIYSVTGYFDENTEAVVKQFQKIFNLPPTGIINKGTWFKIRNIYTAVTRVSELISKGVLVEDVSKQFSGVMAEGETRPRVGLLQYFLNVMSAFYNTIPSINMSGYFGPETRNAIMEFQKTMHLPVTGIVDQNTWNVLYNDVLRVVSALRPTATKLPIIKYPNIIYQRGMGTEQPGVFIIQQMLAYISTVVPSVTYVAYNLIDGEFGPITESAVKTFQKTYGLEPTGMVDEATWNKLLEVYSYYKYGEGIEPVQSVISGDK